MMNIKKTGALKTYLRFIYSVYKNNKLFVISKVFISILSASLSVLTTILPKYMADAILINRSTFSFITYVLLYVLSQFVIGFACSYIELYVNKSLFIVNGKCTEEILEKLYKMVYANYEQSESRDCIGRAFNFATKNGVASFNTFITMIGTLFTLFSYVYIIANNNWFTLLLLSISIITTYILQKKKAEYEYSLKLSLTTDERRMGYYKSALLDKYLSREIRYSGSFALLKQYFNRETKNYSDKLFKKSKKLFLYNQIISIIQLSVVFSVMASFGWQLLNDVMTYGDYTISVNASMAFAGLVFRLIGNISSIYAAVLDGKNYDDLLSITSNTEGIICSSLPEIKFENVSFKYGTEDRWAIKNFTYTFKYGKKYAIVGENGSGKSTILKLMLGMYTPNEGKITLDGLDIREIDPEYLYSIYAVVFQDFRLLSGMSLKENLCVNRDNINDNDLISVIDSTGLKTLFDDQTGCELLQREYTKTFNKDGIELSGGETQKFVIARALLKNAPIIILDEPTSAFDNASQEMIFNSSFFNSSKTIVFVTHNSKLTKYADETLTLKQGRISKVEFSNAGNEQMPLTDFES